MHNKSHYFRKMWAERYIVTLKYTIMVTDGINLVKRYYSIYSVQKARAFYRNLKIKHEYIKTNTEIQDTNTRKESI